jgi:hypothetical protein
MWRPGKQCTHTDKASAAQVSDVVLGGGVSETRESSVGNVVGLLVAVRALDTCRNIRYRGRHNLAQELLRS